MIRIWRDLSGRERGLIAVAGLLALLVLMAQFVVRPLLGARLEARRGHAAALVLVDEMADKAARLGALQTRRGSLQAPDAATVRLTVGRTAQARGIAITRLSPEPGGAVSLWLDDADARAVFAWLVELEQTHGIHVRKADMGNAADGKSVRFQVQLAGGYGA